MSSNENWAIRIDGAVYKELRRLPADRARHIISVIEDSLFNPYLGDVRKVKGEKHVWARRVGDYRIFYEVYQQLHAVNIYQVERKTSQSYKRKH